MTIIITIIIITIIIITIVIITITIIIHTNNSTHNNKYQLATSLKWTDQELELTDAIGITEPSIANNIPGVLFTEFVLPFEVASILLLVAMIGAVVLAKNKVD